MGALLRIIVGTWRIQILRKPPSGPIISTCGSATSGNGSLSLIGKRRQAPILGVGNNGGSDQSINAKCRFTTINPEGVVSTNVTCRPTGPISPQRRRSPLTVTRLEGSSLSLSTRCSPLVRTGWSKLERSRQTVRVRRNNGGFFLSQRQAVPELPRPLQGRHRCRVIGTREVWSA